MLIHTEPGSPGTIRLLVEDRGIGVAPGQEERIFRPFERLHPTRDFEGEGIGLALVKQLVELHDGTVKAHSEGPGSGSVFTVSLPTIKAAGNSY